eukprot:4044162-Amphidinium_carterae.3
MCGMRDWMNNFYAQRHRIPNFPKLATPEFNPDEDFEHTNAAVGAINEEAEDGPSIVNVLDFDEAPDEAPSLCQENVQSLQQTLDQMPPSQPMTANLMLQILQESRQMRRPATK